MEGLKTHGNLKELSIDYFKGKKLASWIAMMTNLVKLKLRDCNKCEGYPPLGQLPKLRELMIVGMHNVKIMGSDSCDHFSQSGSPKTITTMYPSLRELSLNNSLKVEEWLETGGDR